jgi:hypothetical protein
MSVSTKLLQAAAGNAGAAVEPDSNFADTTLLLQADDVNDGSQNNTFLDSSTNTHTITRNGNVTQGSFSPFSQDEGKWGNYFDGDDYLQFPDDSSMAVGTGDFCLECFVYATANGNGNTIISNLTANDTQITVVFRESGKIGVTGVSAIHLVSSSLLPLNQWVHIAVARSGTTFSLYFNGTREATATNSTNFSSTTGFRVGDGAAQSSLTGSVSNARLVKGDSVYDPSQTSISVPTEPLTDISGTSLLTCQSNRFVDNSSNAHAITVNGDPEVTPFSPFAPSTAYDPATKGGSAYFDGNDYIQGPTDADFAFGTGDFTVEAWVYVTNLTAPSYGGPLFETREVNAATTGFCIHLKTNGEFDIYTNASLASGGSITANTWHHLAVVRNSGVAKGYLDGVEVWSVSFTNNLTQNLSRIGSNIPLNNYLYGYISNFRVVKGTAVYTSAFTPPTAPLTAISGTSLLCNFTNAGIYDGTGRNVLETVGDAQVDTAVKKYGTGSMQFDGTGDYLQTSNGTPLGSGDFTIEGWVNFNSVSQDSVVSTREAAGSSSTGVLFAAYQSKLQVFIAGSFRLTSTTTLSTGIWYHVAMVRDGGTSTLYVNGVAEDTYADSNNYTSSRIDVGGDISNSYNLDGYIDDLRITKGVARYTDNFTPPAAKLPNL